MELVEVGLVAVLGRGVGEGARVVASRVELGEGGGCLHQAPEAAQGTGCKASGTLSARRLCTKAAVRLAVLLG
jgi:hypothetical protein